MKFPKSVHAEGWLDHLGPAVPRAEAPLRADEGPDAGAEPERPAAPATGPGFSPWLVGAGAGVALVVLAVSMSRNLSPVEAAAGPSMASGQVQPAQPSPEDAQLAAAPSAAGPETPAVDDGAAMAPEPAATPAPVLGRPVTTVAAAPVAPRPARAPAPEVKTPSPAPELLAQASPPPAPLPEPVQPAPSLPATLPPAATPEATPAATPAVPVPPVAQQAPAAEPEDSGITVQVRQALAADTVLATVPIVVSTEHGVVKLEGQAPDAQVRERATVVAAATTGVKAVDNRLTLPPLASLEATRQSGG